MLGVVVDTERQRSTATLAVLDQLLALPLPPQVSVSTDEMTALGLGYGWYLRVRRTAEAVRALAGTGLDHEAAPLIRSMIEHSVALLWVADARDAAVTVVRRLNQRWARNTQAALRDADGWAVPLELFDTFIAEDIPATSADHLAAFRGRCEQYGQRDLYVAWLSETHDSHPSLSTAATYLHALDSERAVLSPAARGTDAVLRATPPLLIATETMNGLLPQQPWTAELAEATDRFVAAMTAP